MRLVVLLILCAFLVIGAGLAARQEPAQSAGSSSSAQARPAATEGATLTPAAARILHECAKTVLAGAEVVTMQHLAQIDDCAARVRAMILAH